MMDEGGQLRRINPRREVMLKRNFCGLSLLTTMAVSYEFAAFIQINMRIGAVHDRFLALDNSLLSFASRTSN
ncbi:hypothetical protein [Brucella rhizosphaerae]|uniref:hypothetical protein n=1 Tax=Brucella rhizosphaerae TaxID=571254 RepID=UPI00055E0035|nr:hypothetical protein [Brucella rhizosphaerae]